MNNNGWENWKAFIIGEYRARMGYVSSMGGMFDKKQNGISAILLTSVKLDTTVDDLLAVLLNVDGGSPVRRQDGGLSSLGHRFGMFGMVENIETIHAYYSEVHQSLGSTGQIVLTGIAASELASPQDSQSGGVNFKSGLFYGPYFGMFLLEPAFLEDQIART